jgi:hypothetical protein
MTEQSGAATAQAADGAQPQAGNGAPQAGAPEAGGTTLTDPVALQRELTEARREAAKHRTELARYKDAESAAAEAAKTELQKAIERAEAAEKARDQRDEQLKGFQLRLATIEAARKMGFRNPEIAHRLISYSEVDYTDQGEPKNLDALLGKIAKTDPYLVNGQAGGSPDLGGGPRGTPPALDVNTMIRRASGRG